MRSDNGQVNQAIFAIGRLCQIALKPLAQLDEVTLPPEAYPV